MQNNNQFPNSSTVQYNQTGAVWQLSEYFLEAIPFDVEQLIFCCIGTDRSTGDALGPLIGSQLKGNFAFPFRIVGTLESPLHALNIAETYEQLQKEPVKPFIVAIDACLGEEDRIGTILVQQGPLFPGRAVKKQLPPIGDISVKGIVNVGGYMETLVLQNTRLHLTYSMSDKITRALLLAWQRHLLKEKHNPNNYTYNYNPGQQIGYADFR